MAKPTPSAPPRMPPLVPPTRVALERAIILLGARSKGENLRARTVTELVGLLGRFPDPVTAGVWKAELKRLRDESILDCTG
jgi:hypothetical protein